MLKGIFFGWEEFMAKKINIIANLIDKQLKKQLADLEKGKYKVNIDVDGEKINNTNKSMKQLGNTVTSTNSVFGKLKDTITNTFSASRLSMTGFLAVLTEVHKAGQNAKETIIELDKAVTDLSVATNMSRESVSSLLQTYNDYAKELKSTTLDVSQAADDYLRAGKSMSESQELIKDSIMLSKLGQIDSSAATEDLLATMNGFDMSIKEVGEALDAMVAVDLQAATSAGDIATALKYCSSSADVAGLSFNKLTAMISGVQDKTQQSAETIGTFMNTLLSRYRNVKIGQFVDDDGEDLSEVETILGSLNIQLRDSNQEFRDFETVIDEVAASWNDYSSVQQAAIAKAFSGTRQQNRFIALMEGYSKVLDLTEVAADSAGTAIDKYNKSYENSLEAKQNALQASFESMIMNSDFSEVYSGIIDATTALVDFINKTNALKGVMSGLAVGGAIKAFVGIKSGITQAYIALNKFQNAMNIVGKAKISTKEFDRLLLLSNGLSKSQMKSVLSTNALSVAQKKELLIASGLSEEEAILQLQTWKMTTANTGLTASTTSASNAFKALWTTIKANPLMLIISGVTIGVSAWQKYKQAIEEAVSSASEAANTYSEQTSSIDEMVSKYQELREQLIAAKGNEEETYNIKQQLLELQTQLNEQFGEEYGNLNLVTDAYKDQTEAIKAYNKEAAQNYLNENRTGINEATKEMESDDTYYLGYTSGLINSDELKYLDEVKRIASENGARLIDGRIEFVGNAEEASESINNFMNQITELQKQAGETSDVMSGIFDGILDHSGEALADADSIIEEFGEIYRQSQLAEIASDTQLSSGYSELINAVSEYNDAVSKSENPYDDENVRKAYDNLQTVKKGIDDNSDEWGKYADIVKEAYDQADTSSYSFYDSISKNKDGIGDLTDELKGLSDVDLKAMVDDGDNGDTFDKLCDKAEQYGLEVQDLIDLLVQLGIVQGEISSPDIENNTISYDTLTESAESATESADTLRSAISSVNDAFAEQAENGSISVDTMLAMVDAGYATALQFDATTGACTINKEAMLSLVQAKIQNQIADLQILQSNIQQKLADDGNTARESANGFYDLAKAKMTAATAEQLTSMKQFNDAEAQINALQNAMKNINKIGTGSYSTKAKSGGSGSKNSSGSSSSSSKDAWKEEFEAQYDLLKHNLEMEYITEEQYYTALNALNEKYFANNAKYTDEYRKYQEEVYKGLQKVYKDYIENNMSYLEKALDANKISFGHYSNTVKKMLDDMWREGKISASDYWSYVQKMLEKQLDVYDATLSAVTTLLDDEIDKLQDEIDLLEDKNDALQKQLDDYDGILSAVDKVYQDEIDRLQDEKDLLQDKINAINDANDALDLQYRKEQAIIALKRAQEQRNKKLFNGKEFVYVTDQDAIRDAQQTLQDIETEELISRLEDEQEIIQNSIDVLEEYRQKWQEITDCYDTELNRQLAIMLFGENYENRILQNRIEDIESFKNDYISIQAQIDDNQSMIDSYNEKIEYYQNLKDQWSAISEAYEKERDRQYAAQVLGAQWEQDVLNGRISTLTNFKNEYVALQQAIADAAVASANAVVQANQNAANSIASTPTSIPSGGGGGSSSGGGGGTTTTTTPTPAAPVWSVIQNGTNAGLYSGTKAECTRYIERNNYSIVREESNHHRIYVTPRGNTRPNSNVNRNMAYASGTSNAKKGLNLVGEAGTETYIDNDGNVSLVTKPSLIEMEGGETVKNAKETQDLLNPDNLVPVEMMEFQGINGKILKLSTDEFMDKVASIMPNYSSMIQSAIQMPKYDFTPVSRDNSASVSIGEIHLHEVNNVDSFANAIIRELPSKISQKLGQ